MPIITNNRKLNKVQIAKLNELLGGYAVNDYQKDLLKAIRQNNDNKILTFADIEVFKEILNNLDYEYNNIGVEHEQNRLYKMGY